MRRLIILAMIACATQFVAIADDASNKPSASPKPGDELTQRQERIASKYAKLEELMLRMAQLEAAQNPRRAALLTQAVELSKDKHTRLQLESIAALLGKRQLAKAIREQGDAGKSLEELLKLLQSEDRSEHLKTAQERIKEYMKEVDRMIRIQRSLQGQNEGGADAQRISQEQAKLADRAQDLAEKIRDNEEKSQDGQPSKAEEKKPGEQETAKPDEETPGAESSDDPMKSGESKPGESKPGKKKPGEKKPGDDPENKPESKSGEEQPGEKDPAESKPAEAPPAEAKPAETKPGEETPPSESKPGESKPGEAKPSESPPMPSDMNPGESGESPESDPSKTDPQENPVRKQIDKAQQRMKAAEKKLEESKRKESVAEQTKAREELEKAKAELEKILKQLREEEMERTLAALEVRFRKMLEMQVRVFEETKRLDATPSDQRTRELDVQAGRLGADENKIVLEAQKAMQLLEEEGSSVAFPATVDLIIDDMRQTSERLNQGKIDTITQGLEEEIITSLEELLAALEQAQKKLEEQKQKPPGEQQQPPQGEQEQPLVDAIQELKMIKSLQLRVNKRTDRYARLLEDENDVVGQANTQELIDALDKLGVRQKQVFDIVREIVLGRNK